MHLKWSILVSYLCSNSFVAFFLVDDFVVQLLEDFAGYSQYTLDLAHRVLELGLTDSQVQLRSLTDHFCSDSASVAMCENHQFYSFTDFMMFTLDRYKLCPT